jgi:hypothetical protein
MVPPTLPVQVLDHLDVLDGHQAAALGRLERVVKNRQEPVDLLFLIGDLATIGRSVTA